MNRRSALALLAALVAGCGGGGDGDGGIAAGGAGAQVATADPGAATANPNAPAPVAFAATTSIAMWGDSMIPGVARAFTYLWDTPRDIFDGGIPGETSEQVTARETADTDHRNWVTVFWMGHNNLAEPGQIVADFATSIAHLAPGNDRFVVLSLVNNADEPKGSPKYDIVMQLNAELAALYPNNFLDMRSFMVSQFDPNNPQQVSEAQEDLPSSSLRQDEIHLTGFGDEVVGRRLIAFIQSKGW